MAAAYNLDRRLSGVAAVYGVVAPRNPCTTPVKRRCLSLQVVEPSLFPPVGDAKPKSRHVNEKLQAYVHTPRDPESRDLPAGLPPLRQANAVRQRARKTLAGGGPRREGRDVTRDHVTIPDDILPPLKFHASLHNRMPFLKRTSRCPRWLFHEPEVTSNRFGDDTFRIFRPMLYSVLMTQRMTPRVRVELGDNRRLAGRSGQTDSTPGGQEPSSRTPSDPSVKLTSCSGSPSNDEDILRGEADKRSGSDEDPDKPNPDQ